MRPLPLVLALASCLSALAAAGASPAANAAQPEIERGRELFVRTWLPYDTRAATGGDGLGPMYNAASCVACHSAGGVGGGGPRERNVRLVQLSGSTEFVVDHRASTLSSRPVAAAGGTRSERNTPALFGLGLLDAVPDQALLDLAATQRDELSGRVARTADGRVARFGWKGHTASLAEFVATACANELGLSVDGHAQGQPPPGELADRFEIAQRAAAGGRKSLLAGPQRDLTPRDVEALTAFVRALPAPTELDAQPGRSAGHALFSSVGCEGCHTATIAKVEGAYTDMLLHDMGRPLRDGAGSYKTRGNEPIVTAPTDTPIDPALAPALADEWRTPPLWGVRDSAPYLHDGRSGTLDEAIRAHGGEASGAAKRYAALPMLDQQKLVSFLESLTAPEVVVERRRSGRTTD